MKRIDIQALLNDPATRREILDGVVKFMCDLEGHEHPPDPKIAVPTIHLNGTSKIWLIDKWRHVGDAIRDALTALNEVTPHGRDYYVQKDPHAYARAVEQHTARIVALASVLAEVNKILEGIADQQTAFYREKITE